MSAAVQTPAKPWPAVDIPEMYKILTAPGAPYEMEDAVIRGVPFRVYKNAHPHLRAVFDLGAQWADREFIAYEGESMTYDEHNRAVAALGRRLIEFGAKKGDRIAFAMRNLPEWSVVFWAAVAIGAVAVPINAWGLGPDLHYCITDSNAKIAIVDAERLDRLKAHLESIPDVRMIVVRPTQGDLGTVLALEDLIGPVSGYGKLPSQPLDDPGLTPEDEATIFYTSGTTGQPKGVLGTHRNICTNLINITFSGARAFVRRGEPLPAPDPNAPRSVMMLPVPFFHVTGCHSCLVPTYQNGGKLVLMHKWNPERALELIEQHKVTATTGVPTMIWQLIESPEFKTRDTSSILGISYGGAAAAPELAAKIAQLFPGILPGQGYGATETSSVATSNGFEDYMHHPDSVGLSCPVNDLKVTDADDKVLPIGAIGELWIKGPNVTLGYWNKAEQTRRSFVEGWYRTGDVVRLDDEGFVYLLDRARDMLIRGGENIYCVEIEAALFTHPAIVDAAVIGVPHRVLGEEVGAVIRLKPGMEASPDEIRAHVGKMLSAYKVPTVIDIREDELPRNASGKVLKTELRQQLAPKAG